MSTQSRPHGFAPLFRGLYSDQQMRVSDAERQAAADRLAEHFADGRLDQAEFDERAGLAMSAKTLADLSALFADLPETGAPARSAGQAAPEGPQRGHHRPVLSLVLIVVIILVAAHAVLFAGPWLWLGILAAGVLFATRGVRRSHPSQDR
jgi:hypothetical protein